MLPLVGGLVTWRGVAGYEGGSGCGRAGWGGSDSRASRAGGGECCGGPGSVRTGWLPRAHGSQGSDGSSAAAPDAALPEGRRTMGWLPAPTRRPLPLPSTLSFLLGFLFLAAVVLPLATAGPKPKPQGPDDYYGEYCLLHHASIPAHTHAGSYTSLYPTHLLLILTGLTHLRHLSPIH